MIQEYEEQKEKFKEVKRMFDAALDKQKDMIEQHKVDVKIVAEVDRYRDLLSDRKRLLDVCEQELRKSKDKAVMIYVAMELDGESADDVADRLGYSRSQVYRIVQTAKTEKDATKCDKMRQICDKN